MKKEVADGSLDYRNVAKSIVESQKADYIATSPGGGQSGRNMRNIRRSMKESLVKSRQSLLKAHSVEK